MPGCPEFAGSLDFAGAFLKGELEQYIENTERGDRMGAQTGFIP